MKNSPRFLNSYALNWIWKFPIKIFNKKCICNRNFDFWTKILIKEKCTKKLMLFYFYNSWNTLWHRIGVAIGQDYYSISITELNPEPRFNTKKLSKFQFLTKILTFDQFFIFGKKFCIDQNFHVWPNLSFLTKFFINISILWRKFLKFRFGKNFDFLS
mgnify:CR=1 FL=1